MIKVQKGSEEPISYSWWSLVKDLAELVRPYKVKFFAATFFRLGSDIVWLYPPLAFGAVVTFLGSYNQNSSLSPLGTILLLWIGAIILRCTGMFFAKYLGYQVSERVGLDASIKTMQHMFLLDIAWHEQENSGNRLKRINNAQSGINRVMRIWFNNLIEISVNFVGIIFIISKIDQTILALIVVFLVSYYLVSFFILRRAKTASLEVNVQEENVSGLTFEAVNNIRSVKVMAMVPSLQKLISTETNSLFQKVKKRIFYFQIGSFLDMWSNLFRLGGIGIIVAGIMLGHYELGFLVLFYNYFNKIWESIDELSNVTQDLITSKLSIARMQAILSESITIDNPVGKVAMPEDWKKITVQNLSFAYGENKVLSNLSFELNRGERLGVVGLSGAGKSTLFKLLLKEREGFSGDILFDGVSIKNIRRTNYFSEVSAVLQDTEVFNFSLKDNITMANPKEKNNELLLQQALETAHVTDFISKLPEGLDTLIGEKGIKLSGGERQRLGIARAIFRQPQVLLLDEATSHLDLESEEKIQDSLHTFFRTVTAIVIAHRLTTIREMDRILVIEGGSLVEIGTFDELLGKKGRFYELWEKQNL